MAQESTLEKYIKDFVKYHVNENVYLRLTESIVLHSTSNSRSCITLASFWANILQHKDNYPPSGFTYLAKRLNGDEYLKLKTDDVIIRINMKTGELTIRGKFIYDWFTNRFKQLLDNFDKRFSKAWTFQPTVNKGTTRPADSTKHESDYTGMPPSTG